MTEAEEGLTIIDDVSEDKIMLLSSTFVKG